MLQTWALGPTTVPPHLPDSNSLSTLLGKLFLSQPSATANCQAPISWNTGENQPFLGPQRLFFLQESVSSLNPIVGLTTNILEAKILKVKVKVLVTPSGPTLCDPMDCITHQPLSPWDFPGKNTGVGCHFPLQRIFLTQELNPHFLHCRQIFYQLSRQGGHNRNTWRARPKIWGEVRNFIFLTRSLVMRVPEYWLTPLASMCPLGAFRHTAQHCGPLTAADTPHSLHCPQDTQSGSESKSDGLEARVPKGVALAYSSCLSNVIKTQLWRTSQARKLGGLGPGLQNSMNFV